MYNNTSFSVFLTIVTSIFKCRAVTAICLASSCLHVSSCDSGADVNAAPDQCVKAPFRAQTVQQLRPLFSSFDVLPLSQVVDLPLRISQQGIRHKKAWERSRCGPSYSGIFQSSCGWRPFSHYLFLLIYIYNLEHECYILLQSWLKVTL